MNDIRLTLVKKPDHAFLYELLQQRDPLGNISHKLLPTFEEHVSFIRSKPYSKWFLITKNNTRIGSAYITKSDELAIHLLLKNDNNKLKKQVLKLLIASCPRKRYLYNVGHQNTKLAKFLQEENFELIQFTYELVNPKK